MALMVKLEIPVLLALMVQMETLDQLDLLEQTVPTVRTVRLEILVLPDLKATW